MNLIPLPKGIPQSVQYKVETMIVSGFHPLEIQRQIDRAEGVALSLDDIISFMQAVTERLEQPSLKDELGGKEAVSDPLAEMHKAMILLGARIAKRLKVERLADEGQKMDARVDRLLIDYIRLAGECAAQMDRLGVNPWADRSASNAAYRGGSELTVRELIERLPPRDPPIPIEGEYKEV